MTDIGNSQELQLRLSQGKRVAFLVGAPFSLDQGQGVPAVVGFLDIIRERAAEASTDHETALEEILGQATDSQKYQAAMSWVYRTIGPRAVTDVVQRAVLKARQTGAPATDGSEADDRDPEHWRISRGQRGLARLMKIERERFRGPVFTTNFDPLIGLALQEQGLVPIVHPMASDGTLSNNQQAAPDQVDVFHLHGYWRNSATLHKPEQLLSSRPALQGSLEDRLNDTMLVVMAYSGWDDIFTEAIARCIHSQSFSGEILWCFYDDVPEVAEKRHADLLAKFDAGRQSGQISFYCGIDCHTFFDDLLPTIEPEAPVRAAREESPIPGWELVSCEHLDGLSDLTDAEAIRFFDGAIPSWRHAQSPLIPRLSHAETLRGRIVDTFADTGASAMQLIRAAGGEGKSTAMLQAAVDVVRGGDAHVLYQVSKDAPLHPDQVEALDQDRQWLIVADDADGLVDDLWACAEHLHSLGWTNVVFLVAARDADWRQSGGDQKGWATRVSKLEDLVIGGIAEEDAVLVVKAWEKHGETGLRRLQAVETSEARAQRLAAAAKAQEVGGSDGSFFGGLLDTRFSAAGLVDHVVELMTPLREREIAGGKGTLYDALIYIANCHAVGMPGIDKRVLAALCGVEKHLVSSTVRAPLGKEIGVADSGGHILTRHKKVAEAVVVASETRFDTDLIDVWERLVQETVRLGRDGQVSRECHGPIVHAGARLKRDLPDGLTARRRGFIGIAAAEVAMETMPERADVITDRARALRFAAQGVGKDEARKLLEEACALKMNSLGLLNKAVDKTDKLRGYFYEWGTCAGNLRDRHGQIMSVWLDCFSLCDRILTDIDLERAKLSCAGLGVAFEHLIGGDPNGVFAKGRRAVTEIGWRTNPDPTTASYFERHQHEVDELGTPKPAGLDEAMVWLAAAATAAHEELQDPKLKALQPSGRLTFQRLRETVGK